VHREAVAVDWYELECNSLRFTFRRDVTCGWLAGIFAIGTIADNGREALSRNCSNIGGLDL
jgi:hypothetical protein